MVDLSDVITDLKIKDGFILDMVGLRWVFELGNQLYITPLGITRVAVVSYPVRS